MSIKLNYQNFFNYLIEADICQQSDLEVITIDDKHSKNLHWTVNVADDSKLVVKQECYHQIHNFSNDICNEHDIYSFMHLCPDLVYASSLLPKMVHFDENNSILIYKHSADYINLDTYYDNARTFPTSIAEAIGTTLAILHLETMNSQDCYHFMTKIKEGQFCYQPPYSNYLLDQIDPESLVKFPAEGLKFIAFYQRFENLKKAVTDLVVHHRHCCLTHNNLLLNKILISRQWEKLLLATEYSDESLIKLIDWERCSWGDPACDLGTAIAGYLLVWLNSVTVHPAIELKQSLQLATIPLEVVRPSTVAITKAYIKTYPKVLEERPDFLRRVIQFAGLALISEIMARIQSHKGFDNQGICMLQVAKSLLCQPDESFSSVLNTTELELIDSRLPSIN
ncbi:MAG: aminoglycoside phosphotransferase family protein [Nostoc sp.]|uniref:phosphotransferase family protein n=1 Tax=Nostoc sp. TaxID=1180 RepID=UPI002FF7144D